MEINSGFFSSNYDSKNPKNINDRIYYQYIKFVKDNVNVSDPNQIIQMLALKSKIVPTTDGTDHNLNNYIDSWIKNKMPSLIDKFIPNPTDNNIETYVDRLLKYLEVVDICTRKNINLKLLHNPMLDKTDLSKINFKKIKITLDLKEKFKKIKFLIYRSNLLTGPDFDEIHNYVVKNQINENVRSITPSKSAKDIKQEEYGDRFIPRSAYAIYNEFDNLGLNIKKNSRGGSAKKQTNKKKNHIAQRKNKRNILRSNSTPKIFENTTNESIKASDLESYYIPKGDHNFKESLSKLKNKKQSIEDFNKQLFKLAQRIPKMVENDSKLQKAFQEFKKQFNIWDKWSTQIIENKNFDTYKKRETITEKYIKLLTNPTSFATTAFNQEDDDTNGARQSLVKSLINYKKTDGYKTIKQMISADKLMYKKGYGEALKEFFEVHRYSYQTDNLGNRSVLEPRKTQILLSIVSHYDHQIKNLTNLNESKLEDIYVYLPKSGNIGDILKHQEEVRDAMSELKGKIIYSYSKIIDKERECIRCIEKIQKYILEIVDGYGTTDKKVTNGLEKLRSCKFNSNFKDDDTSDDLRKRILFARKNISSFRQCISDFLSSDDFKKAVNTGLTPNCEKILLYYSESLGFIDSYLSDIQNQDKAQFGPAVRRIEKPVATNPKDPPEKREYVWGDSDFWMDMPMWRFRKFKPYLSYQDVEQGSIGDCWLSATLKSMAKKTPNTILNVFVNRNKEIGEQKTNSKNIASHNEFAQFPLTPYITVRLYKVEKVMDEYKTNGKYVDIQVPATLLQDKSGNPHWNKGSVLWPHIIEKAVEKYFEEFMPNQGKGGGKHIDGGHSIIAAALLTGKSPTRNRINSKSNPQQTLDLLKKLLSNGKAAMCGTIKFQEADDDHPESRKVLEWQQISEKEAEKYDWKTKRWQGDAISGHYEIPKRIIWGTHAYSLDKVENATPIENTKIHLINPWEVEDDKVGRNKIYVTLKEFLENFDRIDS